jgi:hypothetical protein
MNQTGYAGDLGGATQADSPESKLGLVLARLRTIEGTTAAAHKRICQINDRLLGAAPPAGSALNKAQVEPPSPVLTRIARALDAVDSLLADLHTELQRTESL